ncbi:hypothetical protein GCM10010486_19330 [Nonomuraea roseoviolacea subsp. carminata]
MYPRTSRLSGNGEAGRAATSPGGLANGGGDGAAARRGGQERRGPAEGDDPGGRGPQERCEDRGPRGKGDHGEGDRGLRDH